MGEGQPVMPPYVKGNLRIEEPLSAEWARTLDKFGIDWTLEPQGVSGVTRLGSSCFFLTEMDMVLEVALSVRDVKEPRWVKSRKQVAGSVVLNGHEYGTFRFRDSPVANPMNLLMCCSQCSRFFFSFRLDTSCGFCGAPNPRVQEYEQISGFGDPEASPPQMRELRQWINENLKEGSGRERPFLPLGPFPETSALFDKKDAEKAKARESNAWEKLLDDLSGPAYVHEWPSVEKIDELKADYPNFGEVCDFLIREIRLSGHQPSQAVKLPNLLLVGGPSCGKSSFAERLARILVDSDATRIDLGQATTNFALVGSDSGFKNGKEGRILRLMAGSAFTKPVRNPLVILDELDKAFRDSTFNPLPALLSLLEKRDAKRFCDEFFLTPVDASGINFLALANTLQTLSGPLLSRFTVFQIPDYSSQQFVEVVVPAIYRDWSARFFPGTFPETLSKQTRLEIAEATGGIPRQVSAILDQLVFAEHEELFPRPTWESLRFSQHCEESAPKQSNPDEGLAHE